MTRLTQQQHAHRIALVDALRSGHYKQGKSRLKQGSGLEDDPATFCCLGVACDIVPGGRWIEAFAGPRYSGFSDQELTTSLDMAGLNYYGFSQEFQANLINANDHKGYDFATIAAVIEFDTDLNDGG